MKLYLVQLYPTYTQYDSEGSFSSMRTTTRISAPAVAITYVVASSNAAAQQEGEQLAQKLAAEKLGQYTAVVNEIPDSMEIQGYRVTWQIAKI
ncbi:MAG TPA: hypothetical protein VGD58_32320 [Herpetosiphonaceae bacterium]